MEANQEELEVSQEKTEAVAEQCEALPCAEAMHVFAILKGRASDVLLGVHKGVMYEETIRATED
jgi:hypothetical protein